MVQSLDRRGVRRSGTAVGGGRPNRPVLSRGHDRTGRYRPLATGVQCKPVSEPGPNALSDNRQDLSNLPRHRRVRGRASRSPARPRTVSAQRGPMNIPAVVRALSGALVLGMGGCSSLAAGSSAGDLGLVQDAMRQVESSYVVPGGPDQLVSGALKGMLSKVDPHSEYMTETEYRELLAPASGQVGCVGRQ